jgi:hypothetical protein
MGVMSAQSGSYVGAGSAGWAEVHPGWAALVAVAATYAGVATVMAGLAEHLAAAGMSPSPMWCIPAIVIGAATFVIGLPAALGFAGACCATQRELVAGVVAGFAALVLGLIAIASVAGTQLLG